MSNKRPVIVLQPQMADKWLDRMALILLLAIIAVATYSCMKLPAIVPVHFNAAGNPDSYGSKYTLIFLPVLAVLVYFFLGFLNRYPHWFNYLQQITEDNAETQYRQSTRLLRLLRLNVMMIFLLVLICSYLAGAGRLPRLPGFILPLILVLAMGPVFFYLAKSLGTSKK
jgi:uncharacterized membrane protein